MGLPPDPGHLFTTTSYRGNSAQAADRTGLTDITEHRTDEGKRYLCAIRTSAPTPILGHSIGSRMKSSLPVVALKHAVALRCPVATIVHRLSPINFDHESSSKRCRTAAYTVR